MCHMVNAMERLTATQHTKCPVLIRCLGGVNVVAHGNAAWRHLAANKSSDSHISQPVTCPTRDVYRVSDSLDRKQRSEGKEDEGKLLMASLAVKAAD